MKYGAEQGFVLVLTLLFLLILTLLTQALLEQSVLEVKMANAFKKKMLE